MTVKYNFEVHTGDELYAGTDANIFVQLIGERGITNEVRLNGYISGNAFERNQTDRFSAPFNRDVGDIYHIKLRSDHMYPGADWLLDYIKVRFVRSTAKKKFRGFTEFQIAEWINDKKLKNYYTTHGYTRDAKQEPETWPEHRGALHHLTNPGDTEVTQTINVHEEWTVEFTLDVSQVTSISVGSKVEADYEWAKAALDINLKSEIERKTGYKVGQKRSFDHDYPFPVPPHTKDMVVQEVWAFHQIPFTLDMGDSDFSGNSQQDERRFVGFIDPTTNTWLFRADQLLVEEVA